MGLYLLAIWFVLNIGISIYFIIKDITEDNNTISNIGTSERELTHNSLTNQREFIFTENKSKKLKIAIEEGETSPSKQSNSAKIKVNMKKGKVKKHKKHIKHKANRIKKHKKSKRGQNTKLNVKITGKRGRSNISSILVNSSDNEQTPINKINTESQNIKSVFKRAMLQPTSKSKFKLLSDGIS